MFTTSDEDVLQFSMFFHKIKVFLIIIILISLAITAHEYFLPGLLGPFKTSQNSSCEQSSA